MTDFCCPGRIKLGATSLRGARTNARRWARGWGRVRRGEVEVRVPKAIRSKSSGRGSLRTSFGWRPNCFSKSWSFSRREFGDSFSSGWRLTTALINAGELGGQSMGVDSHSEDWASGECEKSARRRIASRIIVAESPRFEPRAT